MKFIMKVVVCEDDRDLLSLIEVILSDLNFELETCMDEDSLKVIMTSQKVDLLVIDYWLKQSKADSIIIELKKTNPELPIILMSAINDLPQITKSLGISDYIKKPFDIEVFKSKIVNSLKR
jgi:DNA-binding NtrC family response regulator